MKTIKIDEEAYEILALYKIYGNCRTFSETIKIINKYIDYKNKKIINLENKTYEK